LKDTAERFLAANYDYRKFRAIADSEAGYSKDIWTQFADMGWLGLPFAEADGGLGMGAVEVSILMEAFGKALVLEPYLVNVVLAGGLVGALGSHAQRTDLITPLIEGKLKLAFAHEDRAPTRASKGSSGFTLSGAKTAVLAAPMADVILFSAALPSGATGIFALPRSTNGLVIRPYRTVDGGRAADIEMSNVAAPASALLGGNEDADAPIAAAIERAIVAASADAVGAIAAMVGATVDYTKTRVQFGQPLSKFQVLAHRLVDMKVREEEARASCLFATLSLDGPAGNRSRAVSGAKAKIGRNARFVAQNAIQTHGAIGTTDELALGAYAKRLMAYEMIFGSTREHLRRYGAAIADPALAGAGLLIEPAA
ncbi:MAG: acyl-CoA dehydrogenase family protein, partial [Xanthobacteraceae bacterium]